MSALCYLGVTAEAKERVPNKSGRRLASVSPVTARMGQGEQMLHRVMKSSPSFTKAAGPRQDVVQIAGVCRDSYGRVYGASNIGSARAASGAHDNYAGCIDSATRTTSGNSVHDYFGAAQRQAGAGVGVRLGQ